MISYTPEEQAKIDNIINDITRAINEAGTDLHALLKKINAEASETEALDRGGISELKLGTVISLLAAMGKAIKVAPLNE